MARCRARMFLEHDVIGLVDGEGGGGEGGVDGSWSGLIKGLLSH